MRVSYPVDDGRQYLASLFVKPPMKVMPGLSASEATLELRHAPTARGEETLHTFIGDYIGEQEGYMRLGQHGGRLPVVVHDVNSSSALIREVSRGLVVDVDLKPMPIALLRSITADVVAMSLTGYKVIVHLYVSNPVPHTVDIVAFALAAHHLDLAGDILYNYKRDELWNPDGRYTLGPFENATLDFELNPISEVSWSTLTSPSVLGALALQAINQSVSLGVKLNLTASIGGFVQQVRYKNNKLSGRVCYNLAMPRGHCGGLPKRDLAPAADSSEDSDSESDRAMAPLFWSERRLQAIV